MHETFVVPRGNVPPEAGLQLTLGLGSTLSVAVTVKLTTAPAELVASTVRLVRPASTGAALSETVIVKEAGGARFPNESVAVHVTVVDPSGNVAAGDGEQVTTGLLSTLSEAVGRAYVTLAPDGPVAATLMFAGTLLRTGGVVSPTVTVKVLAALVFGGLAWSRAEQLTVVVPRAKVLPEAGEQLTVGLGSTASVAVGAG
ncbi:MAG TPA: hypothetical protein VIU81_05740 [Gaiellaceae bacterium]